MDGSGKDEAWFALAQEIKVVGAELYQQADLTDSEHGADDPKIIALALLCRSMGNFQGALLMVKEGLIVEARTLVRCCIENLIWIDGLATKGKEFITEVVHDEYKSKMARGKQLLEWVAAQKTQLELGEKLELFLDETKKQFPKAKKINLKASLQAGPLKDLYGFYGVLSADAAHPSASSLSRHIEKPETNVINIGNPEPEEEEVLETLEYGCMAMIGVCVGTNQIIGSLPSGQKLEGLFQEYTKLQQANKQTASDG